MHCKHASLLRMMKDTFACGAAPLADPLCIGNEIAFKRKVNFCRCSIQATTCPLDPLVEDWRHYTNYEDKDIYKYKDYPSSQPSTSNSPTDQYLRLIKPGTICYSIYYKGLGYKIMCMNV